jgi:hypothetical protein
MSVSTTSVIIERIRAATMKSPIAIFKTECKGSYNAVFASTIFTKMKIECRDEALLGIYFGVSGINDFVRDTRG